MPKSNDLIFITGRQRSGTTVLRELFKKYGALDADEIFHGVLNNKYRFYEYVYKRVLEDKALIYPVHHPRLFDDYIEFMRKESVGSPIVIDVKYFSYKLLSASYDVTSSSSFILNYFKKMQPYVLHVERRNKLRVYVSEMLSKRTGVWAVSNIKQVPEGRLGIEIDVVKMMAALKKMLSDVDAVKSQLHGINNLSNIYYEEMFNQNSKFSDHVVNLVENILQIEEVDPTPVNIRMNPEPLNEIIANYDEVKNELSGGPHEWMLYG